MSDTISISHPAVAAMLVDQSLASRLTKGSHVCPEWRCGCGSTWSARVGSIVSSVKNGRNGCPSCAVEKKRAPRPPSVTFRCDACGCQRDSVECRRCSGALLFGRDPISITHPELCRELLDKWAADTCTQSSGVLVRWQCGKCCHEWSQKIGKRAKDGIGCPSCRGRGITIVGRTDIATTRPELAAEMMDQALITQVGEWSHRKVWWSCSVGHTWEARIGSRRNGAGCPVCYGRKLIVGLNDLRTTHPELSEQLVDKSIATSVTYGSSMKTSWECEVGHRWEAPVYSRTSGHGCPECAGSGFHVDSEDAMLYLLLTENEQPLGFGKVHSSDRMDWALRHSYADCTLLATATGNGQQVSQAESVLTALRGRPRGKLKRLLLESLERSYQSIDAWAETAGSNGLSIHWEIPRNDILLTECRYSPPPNHPRSTKCSHPTNGLNRHDSIDPCCRNGRSAMNTVLSSGHYIGLPPRGTVHSFSWLLDGEIVAAMTLGSSTVVGAGKRLSTYSGVRSLELTRLWASPDLNITLSKFVSKCFASIDYPLFVFSYADASQGHTGGIYRACSFNYSGWSDMDRSKHLRRKPAGTRVAFSEWPEDSTKHRYWKLVGTRGQARTKALDAAGWACYDPTILGFSPVSGHRQVKSTARKAALVLPR